MSDEKLRIAVRNLLIHCIFTPNEQAALIHAARECLRNDSYMKKELASAIVKLTQYDVSSADYANAIYEFANNTFAFLSNLSSTD
jgi:hypothetical protein